MHLSTYSYSNFLTQAMSLSLRAVLFFPVISYSSSYYYSPSITFTYSSFGGYIYSNNYKYSKSLFQLRSSHAPHLNPLLFPFIDFQSHIQIQNIEGMNKYHSKPCEAVESSASSNSDPSLLHKDSSNQLVDSHLRQFKSQVQFTPSSLRELLESNSFQEEARSINGKGMEMIKEGLIGQALILLSEAQKILEYAASKGRQVDRNLIISVLHNLACSYQQSWGLQNCSNYIEALIYNLNSQLKHLTEGEGDNRLIVMEQVTINRELAEYYLLFCAINSQLKRNDAALIAAKKGNALLRTSSALLTKLAAKSRINIDNNPIDILSSLANVKTHTEDMDPSNLIEIANFSLYTWNKKCSLSQGQQSGIGSKLSKLKKFSIGNLMQIQPRDDTHMFHTSIFAELEHEKILEKVVIVSMSFFTMATELRLLAMSLANDDKQKARQLSEFRQSQCYHLIAIILILSFVPFDLLFLQHILTSFSHHYLSRLQPVPNKHDPTTLLQSILEREKDEFKFGSQKPSSCQSRNSYFQQKNSNQLQSGVRASLKSQKYQTNKEMAKLNNYYYVREDKGILSREAKKESKQNRLSHVSSKKHLLRRACATSKQSAQKTPIAYSPAQLSPRQNKGSKQSKSAASSKNSSLYKCISPRQTKKVSNVVDQYFITQLYTDRRKQKNVSKSKRPKEAKVCSQYNKGMPKEGDRKDKQNSREIKTLKSASKLKSKLQQGKSKKKLSTIHNYH